MMVHRKSDDRGRMRLDWLDSRFSFSFAHYHDPGFMGFRALREINEDVLQPGGGFDMHPHRDMEIITYVVAGAVAHRDSLGVDAVVRAGEVQRMTAGTGILHSEYNASETDPLHLLQIWIQPARPGLAPGYQQQLLDDARRRNRLDLALSPDGRENSLTVHQDACLFTALLDAGNALRHDLGPGRHAWLQLIRGAVRVNGSVLEAGDGAAFSDEPGVSLEGLQPAHLILFDLH